MRKTLVATQLKVQSKSLAAPREDADMPCIFKMVKLFETLLAL
jgi:hypothetical protein